MTSRFEDFDSSTSNSDRDFSKLELISAYLDGELAPDEKRQVQIWLDKDPETKHLYSQLLAVQGSFNRSTAPPSDKSVEELTAGVFRSVDNYRRRKRLLWGASAALAGLLATVSSVLPGRLQLAQQTTPPSSFQPVMLAVAVDKPAINIPKTVEGWPGRVDN